MASVEERIKALENFVLVDGQPTIEAPNLSVAFSAYPDFNYVDNKAFETKWTPEIETLRQLGEVLKRGDYFVNMVYTYRSCSKALPQVKTQDDPNKAAIYEKTFDVLDPEIRKLKDLMYFTRDTVKLFCEHIKSIAGAVSQKKKPKTIPDLYIHQLVKMLDLFTILDALKNMKACLNNDFSFYKRAFGFLRKSMANDDQTQENHNLYLFLAHQNSITTNLKTEIQQIAGFDDVIALLVNQCARYVEKKYYVTPWEKHRLLRVMPYGLFLMDGENEKLNVFKSKKINIPQLTKLFRKFPIVPLHGDMQISLEQTIKRSPHFDEKSWGAPLPDIKLATQYEIIHKLDRVRDRHNTYIAQFSAMLNQIHIAKSNPDFKGFDTETARSYTTLVLQGLKLLSSWSGKVLRQSAWKYARPNTSDKVAQDSVEYERVVKFNYTQTERFALIEFIACIKGLAGVMLKAEGLLSPIIHAHIHDELQEFVHVHLRDMIAFASKKKREVREELLQLRILAGDWKGGKAPDDPALFGKKDKKSKDTAPDFPQRAVGPSPTQLDLIRTIIYGLLAHRILHTKTDYSDKDFSDSNLKRLESFLDRSFSYPYLMNISGTILQVTDLADLWYREFYLELSKRLQFPIEMSLPWILTDEILESKNSSMMEFMLYPLDLYNDAAARSLHSLNQRFLYDEIEAEVNLCFDQLVFKISEQIYTYFKMQASSILLDKPYRHTLETIQPTNRFHPPKSRYDVLLKQRHFSLLGRSIDLNLLITQRMNTKIRQNIDFAISRFEASDITSIIELEVQLNNIRHVHNLLSKYFELDSYEEMFNEMNESTSLVSFHGRIVLHIIFELVYDFFPNYVYNSITNRFIPSPIKSSEEVPRDVMPKPKIPFMYGSKALNAAYANIFALYSKFFGTPHIMSLLRLVGTTNLPLVVSECLENLNLKIQNVLVPYVRELFAGMPASSKLPMYVYKTEGNFGFFISNLKDLMAYPELQTAFQHFKEFGNTVILLNMFDSCLNVVQTEVFMQAAPFLGIGPLNMHDPITEDPTTSSPLYVSSSTICNSLENQPGLAIAPEILKDLTVASWKADKFYRPPRENNSLFKAALSKIDDMVQRVRSTWCGSQPDNGVLAIDSTTEFYRLWSALQFVFCMESSDELPMLEKFGDGFGWGGLTLIYFLRQEQRFHVFDFAYHVMRVEEAIPTPEVKDPMLPGFLKNAARMRDFNHLVFSTLKVFHPIVPTNILILHPPAEEQGTEFITHDGEKERVAPTPRSVPLEPPTSHLPPPSPGGAGSMRGGPLSPRAGVPPPPSSMGTPAPSNIGAPPPPPVGRDNPPPLPRDAPPPPLPRDDGGAPPPPLPRDDGGAPPPPLPRDDGFAPPPPLPRDD